MAGEVNTPFCVIQGLGAVIDAVMEKLRNIWRSHRLLVIAFAAALTVTGFFAGRLAFSVIYWSNPVHRNQPLEGWMTLGYVAHSYRVDRDLLAAEIGVNRGRRQPLTLERLAKERGQDLASVIAELQRAISRLKNEAPPRE